jgi:prepilin-type N-terminal cleavage/methylation domain-containing protein
MLFRIAKTHMSIKQINDKGFTLIEIAIALVIVGLLAGGGVSLMGALSERRTRNEALDYLNEAKASLVNFAKINGRLPWADANGDGIADANTSRGTFPFQTLGARPADSQGRRLRYEINNQLGGNLANSCSVLQAGLIGSPLVVDFSGPPASFPVAAVLVSAGPIDADGNGDAFDSVNAGAYSGNNTSGSPNYIRFPPTATFDDLVVYLDRYTLYGEMCGNPQLAVHNGTAVDIYVRNQTAGADIGIVAPGSTISYGIVSGSQIQIRNAAGGGGVILASTPAMPTFIAGSGTAVTVP